MQQICITHGTRDGVVEGPGHGFGTLGQDSDVGETAAGFTQEDSFPLVRLD
jgi:hypothetical protein